ncbi:hypothetical protein PROFUN_06789 [Planoprotostelium fungivorum]|uniref:PPPDE domain-containing protein n=1 Tax=Planoprotostelium fungivorum TaxID=1890364 RepID=A0A2P6NNM2_9EUKA|nr:hypothetical protein PROFUN_06789 [Planoprotostelium fungivorum]
MSSLPATQRMDQEEDFDDRVFLHVYDLTREINDKCWWMGVGIFHTGIEIDGREYWFYGHLEPYTGVIVLQPGVVQMRNMIKRRSLLLARTSKTKAETQQIIDQLTIEFIGKSYHPLHRNCNHFSQEMSLRLLDRGIPGYVNRAAFLASSVLRVIPETWIWWVMSRFLGSQTRQTVEDSPQTELVDESHEEEEKLTREERERVQTVMREFAIKISGSPAEMQRRVTTAVFMRINEGTIVRSDVDVV